jgi:hypothetical protein
MKKRLETYVLRTLGRPCRKRTWRDDGYTATCSHREGHDGPCVWGLFYRHDAKCVAGITVFKRNG